MNSRGFQPPEQSWKTFIYPGGVALTPLQSQRTLGNPSGVHFVGCNFRGYRSFLATPPAIHGEPLRGSAVTGATNIIVLRA
jgi:hypothetical protein